MDLENCSFLWSRDKTSSSHIVHRTAEAEAVWVAAGVLFGVEKDSYADTRIWSRWDPNKRRREETFHVTRKKALKNFLLFVTFAYQAGSAANPLRGIVHTCVARNVYRVYYVRSLEQRGRDLLPVIFFSSTRRVSLSYSGTCVTVADRVKRVHR